MLITSGSAPRPQPDHASTFLHAHAWRQRHDRVVKHARATAGGAAAGASAPAVLGTAVAVAVAVAAMGVIGVATARVGEAGLGYALVHDPGGGAVILIGVGWGTCLVGAIAWRRRPLDLTGRLLVAAGATWLVSQWASPGAGAVFGPLAGAAFTTGLVLTGSVPFLVGYLALAYPRGRLRSRSQRALVIAGFSALVLLLGAAATMFLDPLQQGCSCPDNWLLVANEPELSSAVARIGLGLGAGWAALTAGLLVRTLIGARAAVRRIAAPVVAPSIACLLLSAMLFAAGTRRGYLGTSGLSADLRLAQAASLVAVALGVGWGLMRTRRVRRRPWPGPW